MLTSDELAALARTRAAGAEAKGSIGPFPDWVPSEALEPVTSGIPDWWLANDNVLFARPGTPLPAINYHPGLPPPKGAVVWMGCASMPAELLLWGQAPLVVLGSDTRLPGGRICCGDRSTVVLGDRTASTWAANIDCRNGGVIWVGPDGLWAANIHITSDDMHAIRDLEGRRLNALGGVIVIERHVWLAFEALILNRTRIGADTVIGARSVVKGTMPSNSICAGVPARPVRTGVTWAFEDLP